MVRFAVIPSCLVILSMALGAGDPEPQRWQVVELVGRLGHPDYAVRESATRQLDQLGPRVLAELRREVEKSRDGEVLRRGGELISRLEKRAADERALAATFVELKRDNASLQQIAEDLSKQTGYAVTVIGVGSQRVTLHTGRVTFWQAIEQFCDVAHLQIAAVGGIQAPRLAFPDSGSSPAKGQEKNAKNNMETTSNGTDAPNASGIRRDAQADLADHIDQLKQDLEKIAKARDEVARENTPNAKERAARLEEVYAAAKLKLLEAQLELARKKAEVREGDWKKDVLPVGPVAEAPVAAPGPIAQQIDAARLPGNTRTGTQRPLPSAVHSVVLEPRLGGKRPCANFGAVRLEVMPMPDVVTVSDTHAVLIQVWAEPKLRWQQMGGVRVRIARDEHDQILAVRPEDTIGSNPLVVNGNGIQMVRNVNGGVVIINNAGGQVIINGQVNGRIVVNNGNVIIEGNEPHTSVNQDSYTSNPRQVVVKFQHAEQESMRIKEITGVLEALVKIPSEPVVSLSDLSQSAQESRKGHFRLSAGKLEKRTDGNYSLEVELEYEPKSIEIGSPPNEHRNSRNYTPPGPDGIVITGHPQLNNLSGRVVHGLCVTDENDKAYQIQSQMKSGSYDGMITQYRFALTLKPDSPDQPPPKTISFWASHNSWVDIPFQFVNIPLARSSK